MLGQGYVENSPTPKVLEGLKEIKITMIACGDYHMMAVSNKSDVYAWGDNKEGQCGID